MAWFLLVLAGLFEVAWTVAAMYSDGFSKPAPTVLALAAYLGSAVLLAWASREVPIGTAYAVWVGFGAVGATVAGATLFGEAMTWQRGGWLALLLVAIAGLKSSAPAAPTETVADEVAPTSDAAT
jgi:quaternary ammonium compound-resistance protein SugE